MARHAAKKDAAPETGEQIDRAPMAGGTPGAPPEAAQSVAGHLPVINPARPVEEPKDVPPARRYRVVDGPDSVMYAGSRTRMPRGKIVSDHAVDVTKLVAQGVRLEEIVEQQPDTPAA